MYQKLVIKMVKHETKNIYRNGVKVKVIKYIGDDNWQVKK